MNTILKLLTLIAALPLAAWALEPPFPLTAAEQQLLEKPPTLVYCYSSTTQTHLLSAPALLRTLAEHFPLQRQVEGADRCQLQFSPAIDPDSNHGWVLALRQPPEAIPPTSLAVVGLDDLALLRQAYPNSQLSVHGDLQALLTTLQVTDYQGVLLPRELARSQLQPLAHAQLQIQEIINPESPWQLQLIDAPQALTSLIHKLEGLQPLPDPVPTASDHHYWEFSLLLILLIVLLSYRHMLVTRYHRRLLQAYHKLEEKSRELEHLSTHDALTQVHNRRYLERCLEQLCAQAERHQRAFSVVLFDIDRFKPLNDRYGHHVGDRVLQWVTQRVQQCVRKSDHFGRWGGEEFLLLCPETALEDACQAAELLRQRVAEEHDEHLPGVTISLGVAEWETGDNAVSLLQRADHALYRAKKSGRNRVEYRPLLMDSSTIGR